MNIHCLTEWFVSYEHFGIFKKYFDAKLRLVVDSLLFQDTCLTVNARIAMRIDKGLVGDVIDWFGEVPKPAKLHK